MNISQLLVDTLEKNGFTDLTQVSIQAIEMANLIAIQTEFLPAAGIDMPLVLIRFR